MDCPLWSHLILINIINVNSLHSINNNLTISSTRNLLNRSSI